MFRKYCADNGIVQKFIAPGHPATNGLAERYVQILKTKLKVMEEDNLPLNIKVQQILFRYRATPLANGQSPSKLYLGRDIRISLDAMRPVKQTKTILVTPVVRKISVGDRVQLRWYNKNVPTWKFGTVKAKFGCLHYLVKLDNGYELKRHINQLYKSDVAAPKKVVLIADAPVKQKTRIEEVQVENTATTPIVEPNQLIQPRLLGAEGIRRSNRGRGPPAHFEDYVPH